LQVEKLEMENAIEMRSYLTRMEYSPANVVNKVWYEVGIPIKDVRVDKASRRKESRKLIDERKVIIRIETQEKATNKSNKKRKSE
jgi:hypothetical protein